LVSRDFLGGSWLHAMLCSTRFSGSLKKEMNSHAASLFLLFSGTISPHPVSDANAIWLPYCGTLTYSKSVPYSRSYVSVPSPIAQDPTDAMYPLSCYTSLKQHSPSVRCVISHSPSLFLSRL